MFCESCGHSIADTLTHCPYCRQATGVVAAPSGSGAVAVAVRAPDEAATQKHSPSRLTRAEQSVYFRFARGFSWFLLIVVSLGIVVVGIYLVPVLLQMVGSSTSVRS